MSSPSHSRRPSAIDISYSSPQSYGNGRPTSRSSINTPTTPQRFARSDSIGQEAFGGSNGASNGLGNLADELADAWDDEEGDEDYEPDMNFQEAPGRQENTRDSGVDVTSSPPPSAPKPSTLTPPAVSGHRRHKSEYDGSDYGDDSDMEADGITPGLLARMDVVESLVRRGTDSPGTERDGVVKRVVESLKDLGGQGGVEGGTTR
jgi:hypothetical protein